MNLIDMLALVWATMNTPIGVTIMAAIVLFALSRANNAASAWHRWEGTIITGIKLAEKAIPDNTPNAGLRKLDHALDYVLRVYKQTNGKSVNAAMLAVLREGVQITHANLEKKGSL